MRVTLNFGNAQPTRDTSVTYMYCGLNLLRHSQRGTWSHPNFSDVGGQRRPMAHLDGGHHITEMPNVNMSLRVFIGDDSPLMLARVVSILCAGAMTIVGQAQTPQDSIEGILTMYPDVVVLDVQLEGGAGMQVLRAIRRAAPDITFVVFSNSSDPSQRKCCLSAGAENYLDKSEEFDRLAQSVVIASQHPHIDT